MNAFHVVGGLTAIWAVLVAIMGIKSEGFPRGGAEKVVAVISILMVAGAIGTAITTSASEEAEHGGGAEEAQKTEDH